MSLQSCERTNNEHELYSIQDFSHYMNAFTLGGGGVLLEILGGGVPPSSNPDPISD